MKKGLNLQNRVQLPWPAAAVAALVLMCGITLLCLSCQPNGLGNVLQCLARGPGRIILNLAPVGLFMLALSFLFRNLFIGASVTNLLVCLLSIANRIKIEIRDEPVFPRDFALLKEVGNALGSYDISLPLGLIAAALLVTAALAVLGVFVGTKPFPVQKLRGWPGSILGTAVCAAALAALIMTVLGSNALYNSFSVSNRYRMSVLFNENGFPYSFCWQFTMYLVDRPEGYSRAEARQWDNAEAPHGAGKNVHVIMIMDEGFSDVTDGDVFHFEDDPLENLHAIQADPHSLSGSLVVPGFAGGTANTEFDVLTGMQTNALSKSNTSAMRTVNRNIDSVFRVFGEDGYRTSFFHPGRDWFYNRENVYAWMGAGSTLFRDEMQDAEFKGGWITDDYMAGLIEDEFEAAVREGRFLFHYTTTIQNHMSYTAGKYGDGYVFPHVEISADVSEAVQTAIDVYTEGVRDADAMLGRLRDYFAAQSEPVVLVFFGDHLPYLGSNLVGYSELGLDMGKAEEDRADILSVYETPYVIWVNDAAAKVLDWANAVSDLALPEDGRLSASFLGAAVLELTGRGEATSWFTFLNELRRIAPVVQGSTCVLADGSTVSDPGGNLGDDILKWQKWTYYKLKHKVLH